MSNEIKLPSGAILKMQAGTFAESKILYQALLRELRGISYSMKTDFSVMMKDIMCTVFSSLQIESCLLECLKRCTIDGLKIDADTFEKEDRRGDYMKVCMEVGKLNVLPFAKSHFAEFQQLSEMIEKNLS